jgi:nucleolar protein 14
LNLHEQKRAEKLLSSLSRQLKFARERRKPLKLQHHKPIPIPTYVPKFENDYAPNKHYDPDSARAEASRLRAALRKEKKGAIRELRKDNRFLAGERAKIRAETDAQYHQKVSVTRRQGNWIILLTVFASLSQITKIQASLDDERAEEKSHERIKARVKRQDKRRSGSKR